jgi:hypothetical protein
MLLTKHCLTKKDIRANAEYILAFEIDKRDDIAYIRVYPPTELITPYQFCTIGNITYNCEQQLTLEKARNVWYDATREGWRPTNTKGHR